MRVHLQNSGYMTQLPENKPENTQNSQLSPKPNTENPKTFRWIRHWYMTILDQIKLKAEVSSYFLLKSKHL
jgi:hypothetical protein